MPTETIIAAKVFPPKPGKKRGTVVTPDEVLYGAMPAVLAKIRQGGTYQVMYKEDHFNGTTYLVIENVLEVTPPAANATPASPSAKYGPKDDETAERIFVCGAVNASLSNPNFTPTELSQEALTALVKRLRAVWAATFGAGKVVPVAKPQDNDDMSDSIPF